MPRDYTSTRAAGGGVTSRPSRLVRGLGLALVVAAYLPLHRFLAPHRTGPAGAQTRAAAEAAWASGLLGSILVLGSAVVLVRLFKSIDPGRRTLEVLGRLVEIPPGRFALGVAGLALLQAALVAWAVHGTAPTSVDEPVQLLHARALLAGDIALPLRGPEAAWTTLNAVATRLGWASVYPPGHTLWLALWLGMGVPWLAGPVAVAAAAGLTAAAADSLLEDTAAARLGGLLMAFAPYVLLLGGTHLSHATAAALLAGVLFSAARAREGGVGWAVTCGLLVGAAVCTRPWMGLVVSSAILASVWLPGLGRRGGSWVASRVGGVAAGGLLPAAVFFWWNARLFGHPLRLGYSVAFGPAHGLGFHTDPWGNWYGPLEALAYTGADLVQLGAHLLETPLPALALVGAAVALTGRWRGAGPLVAWAAAGVGASALYWHHGVHMGPRMLYETAPAWVLLWAWAAVTLLRHPPSPAALRKGAAWTVLLSLAGGALLAPGVVAAYRAPGLAPLPSPPGDGAAVVFIHGSWASRTASRLDADGMRRDSVETALRRNDLCAVDRVVRGDAPVGTLELEPLPGTPAGLEGRSLAPGVVVRADPRTPWDASCLREARADRRGTVELEPLAWRAMPPEGRLLYVRDLGPAANAEVLEAYPERTPWVWAMAPAVGAPRLLSYQDGMELLWMGAAGREVSSGGGGS